MDDLKRAMIDGNPEMSIFFHDAEEYHKQRELMREGPGENPSDFRGLGPLIYPGSLKEMGRVRLIDKLDTSELVCPACGGDNLHPRAPVYFGGEAVNGRDVLHTLDGKLEIPRPFSPVPRQHRHIIHIQFGCETCDALLVLGFWFYKGVTSVGWLYSPSQE